MILNCRNFWLGQALGEKNNRSYFAWCSSWRSHCLNALFILFCPPPPTHTHTPIVSLSVKFLSLALPANSSLSALAISSSSVCLSPSLSPSLPAYLSLSATDCHTYSSLTLTTCTSWLTLMYLSVCLYHCLSYLLSTQQLVDIDVSVSSCLRVTVCPSLFYAPSPVGRHWSINLFLSVLCLSVHHCPSCPLSTHPQQLVDIDVKAGGVSIRWEKCWQQFGEPLQPRPQQFWLHSECCFSTCALVPNQNAVIIMVNMTI